MSQKKNTTKANGLQQASGSAPAPLTAANLATYTAASSASQPQAFSMQRWLQYTGDNPSETRVAGDWDSLVKDDGLAAAIERATQKEKNDAQRPEN